MLTPLRRSLVCLLVCGLIRPPISPVQAADSNPANTTVPASPGTTGGRLALSQDESPLHAFLQQARLRVEERRTRWLRTPLHFFPRLMQDIQREAERQLGLLPTAGREAKEAAERLQEFKAKAQRLEAELDRLYPPLRPLLVENAEYRALVQAVERRKQWLDGLQHLTEAEQAEAQQLQALLQEKAAVEQQVTEFDASEGEPYPTAEELPTRADAERQIPASMSASELEAQGEQSRQRLQRESEGWATNTKYLLINSEKLLNNFKEFFPRSMQSVSIMTPARTRQPDYLTSERLEERVRRRLADLRGDVTSWRDRARVVERLWQHVNEIRALAEQRLQAAPRASEAPTYSKILAEGQGELYQLWASPAEQLGAEAARREPARRGPLARSLASHPRITVMVEKLNFWGNQGEMGALMWLQTLQRLQRSTALLENTLSVVAPTAAARAGQQQAASLVAILSEGYTAYTTERHRSRNRGTGEAEVYEGVKQQLTEIETRYWKAAAKLFYPDEHGEQELQFYFRPAGELGAAGAPVRARHARFQEVWREQQAEDQLPYLTRLELDHRAELLRRKYRASYDEIILQLLVQNPSFQEDRVRLRHDLSQLVARPDWLRLRPQVEAVLHMAPPLSPMFYALVTDLSAAQLEVGRAKLLKNVADGIQALCRTLQLQPESETAPASEQAGTSVEAGTDLLGAPDARREEEEGSREEESRRRGIEETTSHAPESRPTERAPEAARGHGI